MRAGLQPEALLGTPDAYVWYTAALAPADARVWLLRAAEAWSTADWLDAWVGVALMRPEDSRFGDVDDLAVERLRSFNKVEGLHEILSALLEARSLRQLLPSVGSWLAEKAGPGDAELVSSWLTAEVTLPSEVRLELGVALLLRGFAELRRAERLQLAARILQDVDREKPELRELALRVFLQNEGARAATAVVAARDEAPDLGIEDSILLGIAERALADGADASLALDVAALVGWSGAAGIVFRGGELSRVAEAFIGELADNAERVAETYGVRPYLSALLDSPYELPPLRSPVAVEGAVAVACERAHFSTSVSAKLDRWTRTTAESWFDLHGLARGDRSGHTPWDRLTRKWVDAMLEHPALHAPLRAVLEPRLRRAASRDTDPARAILDAHPDEPAAIVPAVRSLPTRAVRLEAAASDLSMDELTAELQHLLLRHWPKPIAGVDFARLLAGSRFMELRDLEDERKYEVIDGALRLDRGSLMGLVRGTSGETALAVAGLYVVHEMIHGHQGLDDKEVVGALRATGAETTLMHVDLAADHAATAIVHEARRTWAVEWLKDLHCINSRKFPVGPHHIQAARARKLGRVLGLRADYLVRAHAIVSEAQLGGGYAFVELGPAGGKLVLLASGPPLSVLGQSDLGAEDAKLLSRAADRDAPSPAELDAVLTRLLRSACAVSAK
ncbi:MAG: hypothetical protein KC619_08270 [Myxococcales bacterium]|nr:hypothetical protein [Myxococcales bacterium]